MLNFARIVFFAFAALLILGGIAGYLEKQSIISLLAGILCGGMGLYAAILLPNKTTTALVVALIGAILAGTGMLMPRKKNGVREPVVIKPWPSGTVIVASALTAIVAIGALATTRGNGGTPPSSAAR